MNAGPILFLRSPEGDRIVNLDSTSALNIGRASENDVRLDDGTVSRHHARLTWTANGACQIEDLDSANGTALNNARLTRPETLQDGDRLQFGDAQAIYLVSDQDADRLPAAEPETGETFAGRYRLTDFLGDTAEYDNFRAEEGPPGSPPMSLKVFHAGVITQAGGFEQVGQNFQRIRAAPAHPNLVQLLEFGRWRGAAYLSAEWIQGYSLLDVLRRRGALTVLETVRLAGQAALATDHARAHYLPSPDLGVRAVLIAFALSVSAEEWEELLADRIEQWPPFALKLSPRPFDPVSAPSAPALSPLCELVYELLGHPVSALAGSAAHARIASLGESGNEILARRLALTDASLESDSSFVQTLAQAAGAGEPG
jgi:hypothetical protein